MLSFPLSPYPLSWCIFLLDLHHFGRVNREASGLMTFFLLRGIPPRRWQSRDQGKPVWLARAVDIPRAVANFRFFAGAIEHHEEMSTTKVDLVLFRLISCAFYLLCWAVDSVTTHRPPPAIH